MTLKDKAQYLIKANENLENDLICFVEEILHYNNAHLAWTQTYNDIRLDDLEGVIYEYFLKEMNDNYVPKLPATTFKNTVAPLKIFRSIAEKLFITKQVIPEQALWLSSAKNTKRNRYRHLMHYFRNDEIAYFNASHIVDINVSAKDSNLNFVEQFKVKDIFKAFAKAIILKHKLRKNKTNSFVALWVKNMPWTHFFNMAIREIWVNRAIQKYKPKAILFTTANTYSPARMMSRLAKLYGVPFVVVACRSMFTYLRPEERACKIDLEEMNDARIADYFIVWDLFSKNTLVKSKIEADKIFISQLMLKSIVPELLLSNDNIVILTHESKMNDVLIDELVVACPDLSRIVIRTHPLCQLTAYQYKKLTKFEIVDISNIAMNCITFDNCVAISINSTAAVEACSYGCGILWLPYLNKRAVIFEPVMAILGLVLDDTKDFKESISSLVSIEKRKDLINACTDSFKKNFSGNDSLKTLFKKLNIKL
jgi:hypothetical protein